MISTRKQEWRVLALVAAGWSPDELWHALDLVDDCALAQQGLLDDFVEDWGCVPEADEEARAESFGLELPF